MTMLQTKFMGNYIDYGSDVGVFMIAFLLALTCAFSNVFKINNFRTSIYVSTLLHHCHVQYCQRYEDYDFCVFYPIESGEAKRKFLFLSLSLLLEIQCLAASLLYIMSENNNLNSSCTTTAGNKTFNEN